VSAPAPTTYLARARTTGSDRAEAVVSGETVVFDASWGEGPSSLPGPAELLAAAFAACLLKNLARTRELIGFSFEDAEVEVTARRQDRPPRFVEVAYTLRITTDEPERRVQLVHKNLRKFGTVVSTLAMACDVHGEVVALRPAGCPGPEVRSAL